jgi:hypothetical protein
MTGGLGDMSLVRADLGSTPSELPIRSSPPRRASGSSSQVVRASIRSRHCDADVVDGEVVSMNSMRTLQK